MDTLSEAINTLIKEGFDENFRATEECVEALSSKKKYAPDALTIVKSYRFEGPTDPADEMVCFAIKANDGIKGTLVMSFNSEHSQAIETIQKIPGRI
ncbi:phosphoribosylpyrophosphate synthetase [Marinilabilia rubra]|uniref:Phosphoribosylpyrophosphate synthetase n=1 Tax=Marinilabilia rubra TaxID=2162893 RepID=A0A2U2BE15_9BACT|nr:phosphoribosylpyrophosphate synthetase [Marinilabilia rubra]PWE01267.1 phosphoribosylpyrophosphate synthetase [Marinilabilia rubra]